MSDPVSSADSLQVEITHAGKSAIVRLIGSANMNVSASLQGQLLELIASPVEQVIIDMSELTFLSSVGLGGMVAAHLQARHYNCRILLVNPQPPIRDLLRVTHLASVFSIHDTIEQAMAQA